MLNNKETLRWGWLSTRLACTKTAVIPRTLPWALTEWLPVLIIGIAALLPRTSGLADFYTVDEAYYWQHRVTNFVNALSTSNWSATNLTGHPGVTTMWLGAIGRWSAAQFGMSVPVDDLGVIQLSHMRLPLAMVNALAVLLGYLLLRRLMRPSAAFIAALFWALSPFLVAHGRLLHVDGLLTSFTTLSLLALLAATAPRNDGAPASSPHLLLLLLSGACAGLALLTKSPSLLLPPLAILILAVTKFQQLVSAQHSLSEQKLGCRILHTAAPADENAFFTTRTNTPVLLTTLQQSAASVIWATRWWFLWLLPALGICYMLWPAMWVDASGAIGAVIAEISGNAAQAHNSGNFFLGRPIDDPGPLFYPTVILWRAGAPLIIGLNLLLLLVLLNGVARRNSAFAARVSSTIDVRERRTAAWLGCFLLLLVLALTIMPKKFDRYLLPAWPALEILSAVGLVATFDLAKSFVPYLQPLFLRVGSFAAILGCGIALLNPLLSYQPYYLAFFNPLLGGGAVAQSALLTGWGEGMDKVGAWLRARPDLTSGPVLSWQPATLSPFLPAEVTVYDLTTDTIAQAANYAVVYSGIAARDQRIVAEAFALQTPPLYTLRIGGVTYATVHQLPRPFSNSVGAMFGGIQLRGFSYEQRSDRLTIMPSWNIQADQPGAIYYFVHVLSADGRIVAQVDAPIDAGLFTAYQTGQQFGVPLPMTLAPDLPPGHYQVVLGLYNPADAIRLPLNVGNALPEAIDGPHVIELMVIEL
ncbi:phospholipid carrier-dependent glycosyltransferase [Candidatus Gracilibacteria bacterium]|nr:phospholipid carrier-dependent glycosyltransferase [Candidatus Gracilibacteria bacterium]